MEIARFSSSGEFLSVSGSDGRLRIWETKDKTSTIKQEFIPSSHLSATCTCLEWAPSPTQQKSGKKKKRTRAIEGDLIAMGTAAGSLLFYSVAKSQLLSHTNPAHSGAVTGLSWSSITLTLYSCGEDGFICEWDAENTKSTGRWKGAKGKLSCIRVFNEFLLTAGHGITLWNLETKTSIMNFLGHPTLIAQLESISGTDYFVTMCGTEKNLRIWSKSEKSPVATLSLTENPTSMTVLSSTGSNVAVAVSTQQGSLCIFQHKLNGPLRKPLTPISVLRIIESNSNASSVMQQIPILSSFLSSDVESSGEVNIAYGSWLRLKFESMALKYLQDEVTIKRDFFSSKQNRKAASGKNKKDSAAVATFAEIPSDAKHLQPGSEASAKLVDAKGKKRKKNEKDENSKEDDGELPMEDRLSNLTIDTPSGGNVPDGNNLAHLLSQGLHSKDTRILQSVLSRWDQDVIVNTVRSLPVQLIVPLLNEIKKMLTNKAMLNHSIIKWLKTVFQVHSAFLMSCPSTEELLGPFMSLLHSRETLYPQMCQLKGKLELIKGNIEAKEHKAEVPNEALLVYQDESSDDGEDEDLIPSESEEFIGSDDLIEDDDDEDSNSEVDDDGSDDNSDMSADNDEDKEAELKTTISKKFNGNAASDDSMDEDEA